MTRWLAILVLVVSMGVAGPALAQDPPANDLLNAVLWMQRSVEYRTATLTAFALARIRLEQALTDPSWTAAPREQTGAYQSLPPAIILDVDETILDNSRYQAWMALEGTTFDPKTWNAFVNTVTSLPIPGALEFARYADAKGVKVLYVSNRTAEEEPATRKNLERLGIGDNFGDFVDEYRGTETERSNVLERHKDRWGREWIMIANPAYGSFESAPFGHDFKLPESERRTAKRRVLDAWPGR
jgi:acid phosphatase